MDQLWPGTAALFSPTDDDLRALYGYPEQLTQPWVKVNFISSLDGAATVRGRSGGLGDDNDKRIFRLGRQLSDVILVGAATAVTEKYRGVKRSEMAGVDRAALGLAPVPTIAVVTAKCTIEPHTLLVADTEVPPIIYTTSNADQARRDALAEAGAQVVLTGTDRVDLQAVKADLGQRGMSRIDCEGGPRLFGSMIVAELVDELCLSISPMLTSGDSGRIAVGPLPAQPQRMRLRSVLHGGDMLILRYTRDTAN
ncbi:MAG TPA: pyrimidine reductase family protein [Pseudonocardiaceae bacterium]|nr:pyrimidine reductase family protein [Pseudonocardiaceae bacterium]